MNKLDKLNHSRLKRRGWLTINPMVVFGALIVVGAGYYLYVENREWVKYKKEHNCVMFHKEPDQYVPVIYTDSNGHTQTRINHYRGKSHYRCDNGEIRIR